VFSCRWDETVEPIPAISGNEIEQTSLSFDERFSSLEKSFFDLLFFPYFSSIYQYSPSLFFEHSKREEAQDEMWARLTLPVKIQMQSGSKIQYDEGVFHCFEHLDHCVLQDPNSQKSEPLYASLTVQAFFCQEKKKFCEILFLLNGPSLPHLRQPIYFSAEESNQGWILFKTNLVPRDLTLLEDLTSPLSFLFDQHPQKDLLISYIEERSDLR
jgi:hypothetical protein